MPPAFTRAAIAEMVAPDFDLLRNHINPNLSKQEISDAWDAELTSMLVSRAVKAGIADKVEFKRFADIYFEEQQAMIDRLVEQANPRRQMQNLIARAAVRATIWDLIFRL